jgi:hypothetical protein
MVVLVSVVVVCVFVEGRCVSVLRSSYVLRVCVGVWGSALLYGGGVVRASVVLGKWYAGVGVGVVANVGLGCVGVDDGCGIYSFIAMVWC